MNLRAKLIFLSLVSFLSASSFVMSQTSFADTAKLVKHLSILSDKAFFDFPSSAMNVPRVADIMAVNPNANRETRIFVDINKVKMVFFAQELFSLSDKNLLANITKSNSLTGKFTRKTLTETDSITSVLATPTQIDSSAGGVLLNSLLVRTGDNTVFKIDAYIPPEATALKNEFTILSEKIFATLTKGNRRVNLSPRKETYKIMSGGDNQLAFDLPQNYFVTVDEKYDFTVYKLNRFKDISDSSYTSITIYTGSHPSYFHKEYGLDEKKSTTIKGTLLARPIDWMYFKEEGSNFYLKEQVMPLDPIGKDLFIHVAMLGSKKESIDQLTEIVEKIQLSK